MLASKIISNVRDTLSDADKERYTDARLIKLLNDAMLDIATNSTLLIDTKFVGVSNNVVDYDLSSIMVRLLRVEYLDEPMRLYSFEEMDKLNPQWQLEYGSTVKAIIYSKQKVGTFKVYPIPQNAINDHISYSSSYGIVTSITYSDILPIVADTLGDISYIPSEALLKLYYIRKPTEATALTDELNIDNNTQKAIEHYIAGFALRDNHDQQNRVMGAEELKLFYQIMDEYSIQRFNSFAQVELEVEYTPS